MLDKKDNKLKAWTTAFDKKHYILNMIDEKLSVHFAHTLFKALYLEEFKEDKDFQRKIEKILNDIR